VIMEGIELLRGVGVRRFFGLEKGLYGKKI
jgi:hypothetical protein